MRRVAPKCSLRNGEINSHEFERMIDDLMNIWQARYEEEDKGECTKKMIPDVRLRSSLPLTLDHYTSQMLTDHGDLLAQLYKFKLVSSPNCKCPAGGGETVAHVLLQCRRTEQPRVKLKRALSKGKQNMAA